MDRLKVVFLIFTSLCLSACTAMRTGSAQATISSSEKIAVASLLGTEFHGIHVGTMVFGNSSYEASVPQWNIDGAAEKKIIDHLSRNGSRNVVSLPHDPAMGSRLEKSHSFVQGYNYQELIDAAKQQGADTLIVVQPVRYDNAPFHAPGYGFFERSFFGSSRRCVYSLFIMSVISTKTGKKAGWEWGFPCELGETELEWKDGLDKYSDNELLLLRKKTEASVEQNVMSALKTLGY